MCSDCKKRRGFTLVELLVVIAMLMLLAGSVTSSVASAQRRAKIVQATAEAQELTNAILAYENFGRNFSLDNHLMNKQEANESNLGFILGLEKSEGESKDNEMPVLFNAELKGSKREIRDPWGRPYIVTIKKGDTSQQQSLSSDNLGTYAFVTFPNANRRPADK